MRKNIGALLGATVLVAVMFAAGPARAAFPGLNGRIAFVSTRTGSQVLFTIKADGSDVRQLTHFGKNFQTAIPNWSADGAHIVFQAGPDFSERDIWMIDADGANAHRVFKDPWFFDAGASFSPNGTTIVFYRCAGGESCGIWTVGVDGKHLTQLTPWTSGIFDQFPKYSPDGSQISFSSFGRGGVAAAIYVMDANGKHVHRLTPPRVGAFWSDWSPDGQKITFTSNCCGPKDGIWVINADGTNPLGLTRPYPSHDATETYSPQGDKITFERDTPDFSKGSIYVMNADGTGVVDIQDHNSGEPSWGPAS